MVADYRGLRAVERVDVLVCRKSESSNVSWRCSAAGAEPRVTDRQTSTPPPALSPCPPHHLPTVCLLSHTTRTTVLDEDRSQSDRIITLTRTGLRHAARLTALTCS